MDPAPRSIVARFRVNDPSAFALPGWAYVVCATEAVYESFTKTWATDLEIERLDSGVPAHAMKVLYWDTVHG